MKRTLIICAALLLMTGDAFAQKANVKKLKSKIEYASTPMALDFNNVEPEKVQELKDLIEPALTNPESENDVDLWKYASRMKLYDMNEMMKQRVANNNEFVDATAFFDNQKDIVTYYEKYYELLNTPNEKGKLPLKGEELQKEISLAQQLATNPRNNLYIAATNEYEKDPKKAVEYLDTYYASFDHPLFNGLATDDDKARMQDGYYVYAKALQNSGADAAKVKEILTKAMDSPSFGKNACFDLMEVEKAAGNMDAWKSICEQGIDKYPDEGIFGRLLMQQYIADKQDDKVMALADKLIEKNKTAGVTDEWPYYFKAVTLFNGEKYKEAYDAFLAVGEVNPEFLEAYTNAGTTAWKLAQINATNKTVSKQWYEKAIQNFKKAEAMAPDQPDKWGYSLYACYNNSGQLDKAAQYKKYNK